MAKTMTRRAAAVRAVKLTVIGTCLLMWAAFTTAIDTRANTLDADCLQYYIKNATQLPPHPGVGITVDWSVTNEDGSGDGMRNGTTYAPPRPDYPKMKGTIMTTASHHQLSPTESTGKLHFKVLVGLASDGTNFQIRGEAHVECYENTEEAPLTYLEVYALPLVDPSMIHSFGKKNRYSASDIPKTGVCGRQPWSQSIRYSTLKPNSLFDFLITVNWDFGSEHSHMWVKISDYVPFGEDKVTTEVTPTRGNYPLFKQPHAGDKLYMKGDIVTYMNNLAWESLIDNNSWIPGMNFPQVWGKATQGDFMAPRGVIAPSGSVTVQREKEKTFKFTANEPDKYIPDVWVDGEWVSNEPSYTFKAVKQNHKLSVGFVLKK